MKRLVPALALTGALLTVGCTPEQGAPAPGDTLQPVEGFETGTTTLASTVVEAAVTTIPVTEAAPTTAAIDPGSCVYKVKSGEVLSKIVVAVQKDPALTVQGVLEENGIPAPEQMQTGPLDVCVGNGVNDVTGETRTPATEPPTTTVPVETAPPTTVPPAPTPTETVPPAPTETVPATPVVLASGVEAQQAKMNELFVPYGMPELAVDGSSGAKTE